ncbi:MAG: DJ-1/PfpI family protein [Opitutaceae bacterium]
MNPTPAPLKVGAVLFEGFELLDVFGPLEMFGLLEPASEISMLAAEPGSIRSNQGPRCLADLALGDCAPLDVLLVPGGIGTRRLLSDPAFLGSLTRAAASARIVASVCTGSALLAMAGLLDGRRATTNKRVFKLLTPLAPKVQWVAEARWVEDGRFFTSSGVSAGMDMALALISHLVGREASLRVASRAEYQWHEDKEWDPFAKLNGLT